LTVTGLPGKVSHCGICGSWNLVPILDMGMQPLPERHDCDKRYPQVLLECKQCTLIQLSYIADPREVFAPQHPYATGNTRALRDHYSALVAGLNTRLAPGDLVVDIGASDGTLLGYYRNDVRRLGVEPTGQAVKCAAKGVEVCQEFFTSAVAARLREMYGPAKIVTANNVMAHVPDPSDFVSGVVRLLADDGMLVAENHDVNSILDGLQLDTVYLEHNFYYSVTSLSRLLQMHGLTVTDIEKTGTHGGSFRAWARRQRTGDLEARAQASAKALRALLDGAAQQGSVYGIGATTRATPLIHYTQIAEYLSCVCEVQGSEKIGLTIPATSIPIVDEAKLIADQPPFALLLSWHLAGDIVPSLRAKGYKGKFIVPLPAPKVIDG
jgi:hypothetical protein